VVVGNDVAVLVNDKAGTRTPLILVKMSAAGERYVLKGDAILLVSTKTEDPDNRFEGLRGNFGRASRYYLEEADAHNNDRTKDAVFDFYWWHLNSEQIVYLVDVRFQTLLRLGRGLWSTAMVVLSCRWFRASLTACNRRSAIHSADRSALAARI